MSPRELCHNLLHKLLIRSRLGKCPQIYQFAVAHPPTGPARSRSARVWLDWCQSGRFRRLSRFKPTYPSDTYVFDGQLAWAR